MTEVPGVASSGRMGSYARAFSGLLARDTSVLRRDFGPFLLRTVMNPVMSPSPGSLSAP